MSNGPTTSMNSNSSGDSGAMQVIGNEHTSVAMFAGLRDLSDCNLLSDQIESALVRQGAVLLRGLPADVEFFEGVTRLAGGSPLTYKERSTPRTEVKGAIYTSTEYPADQNIPMHNESSYSETWPRLLFFWCEVPAAHGGATPVADSRAMYRLMPEEVRARFAAGVTYTRTFREGIGLSWPEAFQTSSRDEVESYCKAHGQEFEWTDEGLRTRHRRPAWQVEPNTGETVWFNQANLFHATSLDPLVLEALRSLYSDEDLPRHAYYGDDSPIEADDLDVVRDIYSQVSFAFPWERGDIMIVNNMLVAHGRQPFNGARRILVSMTD